ncbi:MAG: hypothetical protein HYR56_19730 [Acidobacteria bacterium]|nr:hypothetical protein [Acidobacteriota bacterium]MBI3422057.1 hypothetical protein [Acidobacteriota bacterium]
MRLSEVLRENDVLRLDSDYYQKEFLANEKLIKSKPWSYLLGLRKSIKSFGAYSLCNEIDYLENGTPFLRGQNIKDGVVDFNDCLYIDEAANALLWKSEVRPGMVLLTMSGTVGNAAVAMNDWHYPVNSNQDIAKITTSSGLNPYFLCTFLCSEHGKAQMRRLPVGSVQQHTFIWQLEKLLIPIQSEGFQTRVEQVFKAAHQKLVQSQALYADAERLLLAELGLRDWQPPDEQSAIKSFKEVFTNGERLDAEFYEPRHQELAIRLSKKGAVELLTLCREEIHRGVQPEFVEGGKVFVIASKAVRPHGVLLDESECTSLEFYQTTQTSKGRLQRDDVLINGTGRGTLGRASIYDHDLPAVADNHVTMIRVSHELCDPYYLMLYLNSIAGQMQSEKYQCGSSGQLELYPHQIGRFLVYAPSSATSDLQARISKMIQQSFALRQQSNSILESAKRAVELAIEQDEAAALRWLAE